MPSCRISEPTIEAFTEFSVYPRVVTRSQSEKTAGWAQLGAAVLNKQTFHSDPADSSQPAIVEVSEGGEVSGPNYLLPFVLL